jgi:hypothetical protein
MTYHREYVYSEYTEEKIHLVTHYMMRNREMRYRCNILVKSLEGKRLLEKYNRKWSTVITWALRELEMKVLNRLILDRIRTGGNTL